MPAVDTTRRPRLIRADGTRENRQQEKREARAALEAEFDRLLREDKNPGAIIAKNRTMKIMFSVRFHGRAVPGVESCPDCNGPAVRPHGEYAPSKIYHAHTRRCPQLDR
jgi:hypothetical protein